ncbi:hypothetical protein [Streptomyces phaeoluteigriseus]|uniref:hypothetical protein n=1 Tax=Streptomyces phaeoluteigriseus TaxID=114686 RepID=UPI0036976472
MAGHLVEEEGLLSPDALTDLQVIDSIFGEMTCDGSPGRWTSAALTRDAGWNQARALARQVLAREGMDVSRLSDIRVVR